MIAPHRHDPNLCYAAFTQHIARCPECAQLTASMCDAARQFLHAWGEAEKREHAAMRELERAQHFEECDCFESCDCVDEGGRPDYDALRETYDV